MRTVRIEQFEGPLTLLLELIEEAKLDISEVSLANVTEQYLAALQGAEGLPTDELADFLVVAARLLLLKSKTLLPGIAVGEGDEAVGLEQQLRLYQRFVEASRTLRRQLGAHRTQFPREHPLVSEPMFLPPRSVTADGLAVAFRRFLHELEPPVRITPELLRRTVSLQEKILHIHGLIRARERFGFSELLTAAGSRTEIIVTFLALLELVKQRTVVLAQGELFEEIRITPHPEFTARG